MKTTTASESRCPNCGKRLNYHPSNIIAVVNENYGQLEVKTQCQCGIVLQESYNLEYVRTEYDHE